MRRYLLPLALVITGAVLIAAYLILNADSNGQAPAASGGSNETRAHPAGQATADRSVATNAVTSTQSEPPTQTPQTMDPTPLTSTSSDNVEDTVTRSPVASMILSVSEPCPLPDCLHRTGVSGRNEMVNGAYQSGLQFGHYLNWWAEADPPEPGDVYFWQMVSITAAGPVLSWEKLDLIVDARPGSIWVVGNEPDIVWQDNTPAERYAVIYHEVYDFIKQRDPTARLAMAGVGQPTPLRLAYLDIVLDTYLETYGEPLPVDIWTIHAFILREERDSWGVGIPPGMVADQGELYEIRDHNNLDIIQQNLIDFRLWMAERGYRDRPLAVTEFGILHPADYGFPPEVVADFMIGTFDFFATAANETGYPADDNRLVQWWFWYSVYDGEDFPTGNLYDPESDQLTPLGRLFSSLVSDH